MQFIIALWGTYFCFTLENVLCASYSEYALQIHIYMSVFKAIRFSRI